MSGAADLIYGASGGGGSGAVAASWPNVYGHLQGSTGPATLTGFTGTHTLAVTWTGSPYVVAANTPPNVTNITSTGTLSVTPGMVLDFIIYSGASSTQSGTVTVRDSTAGGAMVATFNYVVRAP